MHLRNTSAMASSGVKRLSHSACALFVMALVCASFPGCETPATGRAELSSETTASTSAPVNEDAGRLIIHRSPDLKEALLLSIDGTRVSTVRMGDSYNAPLSPGEHIVSAILEPNELNLQPTQKRLIVAKGQTYTFTAMWQGETLVLR